MNPTRPSLGTVEKQEDNRWKKVIRYMAILMAVIGFALILNEIRESFICPALTLPNGNIVRAEYCAKIHMAPMVWGLVLLSFGLLTIQRGDVSSSLKEVVESGTIVRSWWRKGRADDPPGTMVKGQVIKPDGDTPVPGHPKEEDLSRD